MVSYSIQNIPHEERPRERLLRLGGEALSSSELLAILLGTGTKNKPILELAHEIISHFGTLTDLSEATLTELLEIKGLGLSKALRLKSAFYLGARVLRQKKSDRYRIEHPAHAYHLLKEEIEKETREIFFVILLNRKGYLITHEIVSIGSLSETIVHPREVFYPAIRHKAASFLVAHNHPSGELTPSKADLDLTRRLVEASHVIGIPLNDHMILGRDSFLSFRQQGLIFRSNVI